MAKRFIQKGREIIDTETGTSIYTFKEGTSQSLCSALNRGDVSPETFETWGRMGRLG